MNEEIITEMHFPGTVTVTITDDKIIFRGKHDHITFTSEEFSKIVGTADAVGFTI